MIQGFNSSVSGSVEIENLKQQAFNIQTDINNLSPRIDEQSQNIQSQLRLLAKNVTTIRDQMVVLQSVCTDLQRSMGVSSCCETDSEIGGNTSMSSPPSYNSFMEKQEHGAGGSGVAKVGLASAMKSDKPTAKPKSLKFAFNLERILQSNNAPTDSSEEDEKESEQKLESKQTTTSGSPKKSSVFERIKALKREPSSQLDCKTSPAEQSPSNTPKQSPFKTLAQERTASPDSSMRSLQMKSPLPQMQTPIKPPPKTTDSNIGQLSGSQPQPLFQFANEPQTLSKLPSPFKPRRMQPTKSQCQSTSSTPSKPLIPSPERVLSPAKEFSPSRSRVQAPNGTATNNQVASPFMTQKPQGSHTQRPQQQPNQPKEQNEQLLQSTGEQTSKTGHEFTYTF